MLPAPPSTTSHPDLSRRCRPRLRPACCRPGPPATTGAASFSVRAKPMSGLSIAAPKMTPEHRAVGRQQRTAGIPGADVGPQRVHVPGHRGRRIDVRAVQGDLAANPARADGERTVERITGGGDRLAGLGRMAGERQRRPGQPRHVEYGEVPCPGRTRPRWPAGWNRPAGQRDDWCRPRRGRS